MLSSDASSSSRESSPQVPAWSESNNGQVEASSSNTDDQRVLVVNLERLSPERYVVICYLVRAELEIVEILGNRKIWEQSRSF